MDQSHVVDQRARDMAQAAKAAIESHEKVCIERWGSAMATMEEIKKGMLGVNTAINDKIGKLPAGIIAALTGLCGFLAARVFPTH